MTPLAKDKAPKKDQVKCAVCGKGHETPTPSNDPNTGEPREGNNIGDSIELRENILNGQDHPWELKGTLGFKRYSDYYGDTVGIGTTQAHHLIVTESMKPGTGWERICTLYFGYNINSAENGVILPSDIQLACHLKVPLHRGNHAKGLTNAQKVSEQIDEDGNLVKRAYFLSNKSTEPKLTYDLVVRKEIEALKKKVRSGSFCGSPSSLIRELDNLSEKYFQKIKSFDWIITSDGKDYKPGGIGCANIRRKGKNKYSISLKKRIHRQIEKKVILKKDAKCDKNRFHPIFKDIKRPHLQRGK